jgi:hypothetical protein
MKTVMNSATLLSALVILTALLIFAPAPGRAETKGSCNVDCPGKGSCSCASCTKCYCDKDAGTPICESGDQVIGVHTSQGAIAIIGPFGDMSTVTVARGAGHGNVTAMSDGSLLYAPHPDFIGLDSFAFDACNVSGDCELATVLVDIVPASKP